MIAFFYWVIGTYLFFELALILSWQILMRQQNSTTKESHDFISVIVPFRNEEKNITTIIHQLNAQLYPPSHYEVILINDHSSDFSLHFAEVAIIGKPNFRLYSLSGKEGKKHALHLGIHHAKGTIVATTDADCEVPVNWLKSVNHSFGNDTKFVFGGVQIRTDSTFFSKLQALEFCSLIGSGAATLKIGFPTMCNGANLAFLKSAFHEVEGYEGNWNIPSGDDEFLMRKIHHRHPNGISFLNSSNAVISTQCQADFQSFIQQRLRWAGKWKYNQSWASKLLAVFIFAVQLSFLVLLVFMAFRLVNFKAALILVLVKIFVDFLFLYLISDFLRLRWHWRPFFCLQIVYPLYVVFIGLRSQAGHYFWKGRKLSHQV